MIKRLLIEWLKSDIKAGLDTDYAINLEKIKSDLEADGIKLLRELFYGVITGINREPETWKEFAALKEWFPEEYQRRLTSINMRDAILRVLSDKAKPLFDKHLNSEKFIDDIVDRINRKQLGK